MPEGRFIRLRHKMMWIDTVNNAVIDADTGDQNMSEAGLNILREYDKLYEARWRRSVV